MSGRAMPTISTILADDEPLALDELAYLLKEHAEIEIVATVSDGLDAVDKIEKLEPDLVFLDVQMPGLDGLGVINRLREHQAPQPAFVLCTAYEQYALEAFKAEVLDYLLKPVDRDRLALTIARLRRTFLEPEPAPAPAPPSSSAPAKLIVRSSGRNWIVDASDIVYATIDDGLITVVTTSVEGQSNYKTIEELQSALDPGLFWRVHRSFLVNVNRIKEVVPWFKSSYQLRMDDKRGSEIPVSRVQTKRLRAMFKL